MQHKQLIRLVILLIVNIKPIDLQIQEIREKVDETHHDKIAAKVMQIISICFSDELDMVVFAGTLYKFKIWKSHFPPTLTMYYADISESTIFNRHKRLQNAFKLNEFVVSKLRFPGKLFIVSVKHLSSLLIRLKQWILWNSRAIFFLINDDFRGPCPSTFVEFQEVWKFNILHAFFVCSERSEIEIYTFNPFAKMSPNLWEILTIVNVNHRNKTDSLAIFRYKALTTVIDQSMCRYLKMDKTADFEGYTIQIMASSMRKMFDWVNTSNTDYSNAVSLAQVDGVDVEILNVTLNKLNIQASVTIFKQTLGFISNNNEAHGIIGKLLHENTDVGGNERYQRGFWRLETYPHDETETCLMTRRITVQIPIINGFTQMILSAPGVLLLFSLVNLVSIALLIQVLKIRLGEAILELLRIFFGLSTIREPEPHRHGRRLILLNVVLFSFWINLYFGTQLTSSFAIQEDDPNINTIEDLKESGYQIAGDMSFKELICQHALCDRFKESIPSICIEQLMPRDKVACIDECYDTSRFVRKDKNNSIHVSDPVYKSFVVYYAREDWPILPKFSSTIQHLMESGILRHIYDKYFYHGDGISKELARSGRNNLDVGFHGNALTPSKLIYCFRLYVLGIAVGFSTFFVEILRDLYFQNRTKNKKLQRLNILQSSNIVRDKKR